MRALVVMVVLALAAPAAAEPTVAVIGDDTAGVITAVKKALDPHVALVAEGETPTVIVVVSVKGTAQKARATITVRQAFDDTALASLVVKDKRKRLARQAKMRVWRELGKAIEAAQPAPPPAPEEPAHVAEVVEPPAPEPVAAAPIVADDKQVVAAAPKPRPDVPWLVLTVDGRPFLRTLRYRDDLDQQLRPYDLAAPAAGITAQWRPKPRGPARFFAVRAELELALGVEGSRTEDGMELGTSSSEWSAGARAEVPIAGWRWTADVSYGEHRFSLDDDAMPEELIPDVTYRYARGALGVTAPVADRLAVVAGLGWRQLLGTGDLGSAAWFPRATGNGLDAEAGVTWRAFGVVDLYGRAELRRYFFAMHPEPGDDLIVGGAVDQYLGLTAGVSVSLR